MVRGTPPCAPLRVAVLVQSEPRQDSRLRKQVESLGQAGHLVDVYGPLAGDRGAAAVLPGARRVIAVDFGPRDMAERFYRRVDRMLPRLSAVILGLLGGLMVAAACLLARPWGWGGLLAVAATACLAGYALSTGRGRGQIDRGLARLRRRFTAARRERFYHGLAMRLAEAVRPEDYDVLHCHDLIPLQAGALLKRGAPHLRLIWDAHEFYQTSAGASPSDRGLFQRMIQQVSGQVDQLITINDSIAQLYAAHFSALPAARIVMNATRHAALPAYDGRLHRSAGLEPGRRILLFQGGLHAHRGIEILLEAAADLPPPWALVFMGEGPLAPRIESAVKRQAGRARRLALLPAVPNEDLRAWTAGASLGVIPYENQGLNHLYCTPNKLWEFPDAGVPVLASDLVEMGRMIRTHGTGFLLPRNFTAADLLAILNKITSQDMEAARDNCAAFGRVMSWAKFEPELLKAYSHDPKHLPQT